LLSVLEIIDVGCNLKQFDGLTRLTPNPAPYLRQIYATGYNYDSISIRLEFDHAKTIQPFTDIP